MVGLSVKLQSKMASLLKLDSLGQGKKKGNVIQLQIALFDDRDISEVDLCPKRDILKRIKLGKLTNPCNDKPSHGTENPVKFLTLQQKGFILISKRQRMTVSCIPISPGLLTHVTLLTHETSTKGACQCWRKYLFSLLGLSVPRMRKYSLRTDFHHQLNRFPLTH